MVVVPSEDPQVAARFGEKVFIDGHQVQAFDKCDALARCRELLRRLAGLPGTAWPVPWHWDIVETFEDSRDALRDIGKLHAGPAAASILWQEIFGAVRREQDASSLPSGLRKQCEDFLARREVWSRDFDAEVQAVVGRGSELCEQLLFNDSDRSGWFGSAGVELMEVRRLLERHVELHQRAARLDKHLQLVSRALRQQGAVSCRRRPFVERTVGDKLQSSLVTFAAAAVMPVPGTTELWLASTAAMWIGSDHARQHVVYEHSRDTDMEHVLKNQFQCLSGRTQEELRTWMAMPPARRRGCVLVHNASIRRVVLKTRLVNCIDGQGSVSMWTAAFDNHPLASVLRRALGNDSEENQVVIGSQRLAVVQLPPKPDTNWGWRGAFSYHNAKVGECSLREGGIFSFICVDCGLRVGDRNEEEGDPPSAPVASDTGNEGSMTAVEVVNRIDDPVQVKIFSPSVGGAATFLFHTALAEGSVAPGARQLFRLPACSGSQDSGFDVEVKIGGRKALCEVVGAQVIYIDGMLAES